MWLTNPVFRSETETFRVGLHLRFGRLSFRETGWRASPTSREVAWEIKTGRQPVSPSSVDFTRYSRTRLLSSVFVVENLASVCVI